jgi:hypothetical protein
MKALLRIWSYVINPLFIPLVVSTYYYLVISYAHPEYAMYKIAITGIITVVIPLLIFLLLRITGAAQSVHLSDVRERTTPLAAFMALVLILLRTALKDESFSPLYYFYIGVLLSSFGAFILVLLKYKISLHMLAISGLLGFAIMLNLSLATPGILTIIFLILVVGITATSRLSMNAHQPDELIYGVLLGILPQIGVGLFFF